MTRADLHRLLRAEPFRPFRIVTADGTRYDVPHPELVLADLTSAAVGYPDPADRRAAEHYDIIALSHINRFKFLEAKTPAEQGDGAQES